MDLLTAVKATYEVVGQDISDLGIQAIVTELKQYDLQHVLLALTRCRKELRKLTLADILDRLPGGHPGVEEAWAIVSRCLSDENASVVWTDEIASAFGVARSLANDPIAARMAFKEKYVESIQRAKATHQKPVWRVSLGYDLRGREIALREAVDKGRVPAAHALKFVPMLELPNVNLPAVQGF